MTVPPSARATIDSKLERIALAYLERIVGVQLGEPRGTARNPPTRVGLRSAFRLDIRGYRTRHP